MSHADSENVTAETVTDVVSPDHAQHLRLLDALVFAGTQALDEKELADRLPNEADVKRLIVDLTEMYAGRGVNLVQVAGGYAFRTAPDLSEKLKIERPVTRKLSRAAIETLAIIAYHQPVTRTEIEQVRGVGLSKGTLDLLFEQNWIRPMGRRRVPGRPVTWGTTDFFLEHFGLASLEDLPGHEELKAAGLLDARAQTPIFRPEEPDLPFESDDEEADDLPPHLRDARDAMENGEFDTAASLLEKAIAEVPSDGLAKSWLAQVNVMRRVSGYADAQAIVSEAAVQATPEERRPWMEVGSLARTLEPAMVLSADLNGLDLIKAVQQAPASEYLLVEPSGQVFGVLAASDLDIAFAGV